MKAAVCIEERAIAHGIAAPVVRYPMPSSYSVAEAAVRPTTVPTPSAQCTISSQAARRSRKFDVDWSARLL